MPGGPVGRSTFAPLLFTDLRRLYIDTGGLITQAIEASVNDVAGGNGTRTSGLILDGTINVKKDEDARCYLFPDKPSILAQIRQLFDGKISRLDF